MTGYDGEMQVAATADAPEWLREDSANAAKAPPFAHGAKNGAPATHTPE